MDKMFGPVGGTDSACVIQLQTVPGHSTRDTAQNQGAANERAEIWRRILPEGTRLRQDLTTGWCSICVTSVKSHRFWLQIVPQIPLSRLSYSDGVHPCDWIAIVRHEKPLGSDDATIGSVVYGTEAPPVW